MERSYWQLLYPNISYKCSHLRRTNYAQGLRNHVCVCDIHKIELSQCNIKKHCAQLLTSLSLVVLTQKRCSTYGVTPPPFLDLLLLMPTHPLH